MQRWGWLDEICIEVFLNEFFESLLFRYQKRVYGANRKLSTFFQIDFKIIRTTSALVLLKTLANLWYLEGILERSEASASFAELAWMLWNALDTNNFHFILFYFPNFIWILFFFSFLFFWTMKRHMILQLHDMML